MIAKSKDLAIQDLLKDVTDEEGMSPNENSSVWIIFDNEGYVTNVKFCALLIRNLTLQIEDLERIV